jgi:hypothetical protein
MNTPVTEEAATPETFRSFRHEEPPTSVAGFDLTSFRRVENVSLLKVCDNCMHLIDRFLSIQCTNVSTVYNPKLLWTRIIMVWVSLLVRGEALKMTKASLSRILHLVVWLTLLVPCYSRHLGVIM